MKWGLSITVTIDYVVRGSRESAPAAQSEFDAL
jgi:hypothetical protein